MKNAKMVSFVLVFVLISISCNFLTPKSPNNSNESNVPDNAPAVDFITPAEPLNVTVQLDELYTVSGVISINGGSMVLTGADGSVFTLDVPAKALATDTVITMTVVKSITGAPLSSAAVAAVQLEPSGLFFNEFVTLTVTPAQAIPIENQIIFGYEGNGQDYHLAIIDPKSREIKIKLLEFSGAGVGSGGDKEWAANLQNQASSTSARLWQKFGEYSQKERMGRILGEIPDDTDTGWVKSLENTLNQFEDQVVLKESVAAELDCQYARKALEDLVSLERMRQLFPVNDDPIKTKDFAAKVAKLVKIGENCKKSYVVNGVSNDVSYSGEICNLDKPFVLNGTYANGSETQSFTPSNATGGTVEESGTSDGCTNSGEGTYTVTLNEQGSGELQWTESITSSCPPYSVTNTLAFILPLNPASDLSCP